MAPVVVVVLLQFFTSVESWARAKARLAELGLRVNEEESGLVFRASAPVEVGALLCVNGLGSNVQQGMAAAAWALALGST